MKTLSRAFLFSSIALVTLTGAGCPSRVKLERPISLYKGCPQFAGICQKTKTELKKEVKAAIPSISDQDLDQWIEENLTSGTKIKVLPAKSPFFTKFTCAPTDDMGVVLKALNDIKRISGK